jgi:hypothetical protein
MGYQGAKKYGLNQSVSWARLSYNLSVTARVFWQTLLVPSMQCDLIAVLKPEKWTEALTAVAAVRLSVNKVVN